MGFEPMNSPSSHTCERRKCHLSLGSLAKWHLLCIEGDTTFDKNLVCLFLLCGGGGGVGWGDENNIGKGSSTFGKFHILINPKNNRLASIMGWKHMISIMPEAYDQCKLCSFRISTQHDTHTKFSLSYN